MELTISIDLEVSDEDVANDIVAHLELVLPYMADNVLVCSEQEGRSTYWEHSWYG